jgi:hypothetical protein
MIDKLTSSEMKNINGGIMNRRRRDRNPTTTDRSDLSPLVADIKTNVGNWRLELNKTIDNLREERLDF